jgi:hypothetical protein
MLLTRPKVFGEIDIALNIWSSGDDGGNMHLQNVSVKLHNYTACEPTDCNIKILSVKFENLSLHLRVFFI